MSGTKRSGAQNRKRKAEAKRIAQKSRKFLEGYFLNADVGSDAEKSEDEAYHLQLSEGVEEGPPYRASPQCSVGQLKQSIHSFPTLLLDGTN